MNISKLFVYILGLFLMINLALAIGTYQETASVARIVGESPAEMIKQMQRDSVEIKEATYYRGVSTPYVSINNKESVLTNQFGYNNVKKPFTIWNFDSFEVALKDMKKNELLILEADGGIDPLHIRPSIPPRIEPVDARDWQDDFEEKNPLFLLDSPYGGAYIPKEDSFVSRLVRDSTIIAPTSFNTEQFVTSTLCMLYNEKTVGQLFRDARNFHYNGGSTSGWGNYVGLILQSYALYGNPRQKITMPVYDMNVNKMYCKNFLQNLAEGIEFIGYTGNYSKFRKHLAFNINSYNLVQEGNFTIINASNTFTNLEFGELVLPKAIRTTYFPKETIITNVTLNAVYDPVNISVRNLPSYEFDFVNRTCYYENQTVIIEFSNSYSENSQDVITTIYPVEVINCSEGKFRLFKKFNYSIDYIAISPVLIKEVNSPIQKTINEEIPIEVELMNLMDKTVNGSLAIFDGSNKLVYEKEVNTNITKYNLSFFAPPIEGNQKYSIEFLYNNKTVSYKEFFVDVKVMDLIAEIPVTAGRNQVIKIDFYSYFNQQFPMKIGYYLRRNFTILQNGTIEREINPGSNIETIQLNNLLKEEQSYALTLEMSYLNGKRGITYLIVTNNQPLIYVNKKESYEETELVNLSFNALDYENDSISVMINDPRFIRKGDSFVWQTTYYDNGTYHVTIKASDGLLENIQNITINVLDLNKVYNLTLNRGRNLVSIPLPLNQSIGNVFGLVKNKIGGVFSYEGGLWKGYTPSSNSNTLANINSTKGYWIKVNESVTVGVLIIPEEEVVYNLKKGWNLISYIAEEEDIGSALGGIDYEGIFGYINGSWVSNDKDKPDVLNTLKTLKPGYGYWVNLKNDTASELDTETGLFYNLK